VSGDHHGPQAVLTMYGKLAELSAGTIRAELEDLLSDGGDRVIAVHRATAERNGQRVTSREALLFRITEGKVVEVQDFFTDIAAMETFWS
jgi:ketosteroid isomerase-like protein